MSEQCCGTCGWAKLPEDVLGQNISDDGAVWCTWMLENEPIVNLPEWINQEVVARVAVKRGKNCACWTEREP